MKMVKTPMGHTIYKLEEFEVKAALLNYIKQFQDIHLIWDQSELMLNSFGETYSIYYRTESDEKS